MKFKVKCRCGKHLIASTDMIRKKGEMSSLRI